MSGKKVEFYSSDDYAAITLKNDYYFGYLDDESGDGIGDEWYFKVNDEVVYSESELKKLAKGPISNPTEYLLIGILKYLKG